MLLWNPYINCGAPDMAYVEMGSFSPLTLALAAVTGGGHTGFLIYWMAIWAIFGAGSGLLGLRLGAPRPAALAIAAGLMSCGFFLGHATHTSWLYAFSFLPLILWRLEAALAGEGLGPVAEAGALFGLSALAGHPALVILNGMYAGLWVLGRSWLPAETAGRPGPRRTAVSLALLLAVAVMVLSPAYFAFFHEAAGYSERTGYLDRAYAISKDALQPGALATLASPWLTVLDRAVNVWPRTTPFVTCCYLGAVVPALALAGLIRRRRGFALWIAAVGIFFLLAAVGDALPVRGWLYDWFPPTRYFRHSGVMRAYFLFSAGALAMMAAAELRPGAEARRFWRAVAVAAAVLTPVMVAAFIVAVAHTDYRAGMAVAMAQMVVGWGGLLAVAGYGWRRGGRGAAWMLVALSLVDGGFSLVISRPFMVLDRQEFGWLDSTRVRSVDLMSTGLYRSRLPEGKTIADFNFFPKVPVLEAYSQLSHRFHSRKSLTPLSTSWSNEPALYSAVIGSRSDVWFSPQAPTVFPSDATFMALVERSRELGAMPMVINRPEEILKTPPRDVPGPNDDAEADAISRLPACRRLEVQLIDYTPTRLTFRVDCPEAGWLLVTDRWSRSWQAKVDGRAVAVMGGNFLFRAVAVGPGPRTVAFEFRPRLYPLLLWVSWGTMAVVVGVSLYRWRRTRRS